MREFIVKYRSTILILLTLLGGLAALTVSNSDDKLVAALKDVVNSVEEVSPTAVVAATSSTTVVDACVNDCSVHKAN